MQSQTNAKRVSGRELLSMNAQLRTRYLQEQSRLYAQLDDRHYGGFDLHDADVPCFLPQKSDQNKVKFGLLTVFPMLAAKFKKSAPFSSFPMK